MLSIAIASILCISHVNSKLILAPGVTLDAASTCPFTVDIANVLDTTYSQFDNLVGLKANLTAAMQYMEAQHPSSQSALAIFTDKPVDPLGWDEPDWKDFCARVVTDFTNSNANMQIELNKLSVGGGFDFPEAQLEAILRTALSDRLNWRASHLETGEPILKVILLVTDSIFHTEGNAAQAVASWNANHPSELLPEPRPNDLVDDQAGIDLDINFDCSLMDYPSLKDVGDALREHNIIPVIMTTPSGWDCDEETLCPYPEMEDLAASLGNPALMDPYLGLPLVYEAALLEMGVTGIVEPLRLESEDFYQKFLEVVDQLDLIPKDCGTTTTAAPTDTQPPQGTEMGTTQTVSVSETTEPECIPETTADCIPESTEGECVPGTTDPDDCKDGHMKIHIAVRID